MLKKQGVRFEKSAAKAEDGLKLLFKRRLGQAVIARDVGELIRKLPRTHGVNNVSMIDALHSMKLQGLIKIKKYNLDTDHTLGSQVQYRIKLTGRGRALLNLQK